MNKIYIVGSVNMDLIVNTDIFPDAGMTVKGYGFISNPGGKGANQAVSVSKCGGNAFMVGAVGKEFGDELTKSLINYGVNADNLFRFNDLSSGIAVITVNRGENRIILDSGANGRMTEEIALSALDGATVGDILIVQLEIPVNVTVAALKKAKEKGMRTVLNPAPACELTDCIWQLTDYFIPNQTEARFYTGIYPNNEETALTAAKKLLQKGVKNVIITLGDLGAVSVSKESDALQEKVVFASAYKAKAVDTTAAGDTFVGAFATRIQAGDDIYSAMDFANSASSLTVTRKGAQQSIPMLEEILEYRRNNSR